MFDYYALECIVGLLLTVMPSLTVLVNPYVGDCIYTSMINLTFYVLNQNVDDRLDCIFLNELFELLEWTAGKLLALSMR